MARKHDGGFGRRKVLKGAAGLGAAALGSGVIGAPTIWAQNIKNVTLRQFGTGVSNINEVATKVKEDLGFKLEMSALDSDAFKVNLIPYNPTGMYGGSSRDRIASFRDELARARVPVTIRLTRGRDIEAACGQLAAAPKAPRRAASLTP